MGEKFDALMRKMGRDPKDIRLARAWVPPHMSVTETGDPYHVKGYWREYEAARMPAAPSATLDTAPATRSLLQQFNHPEDPNGDLTPIPGQQKLYEVYFKLKDGTIRKFTSYDLHVADDGSVQGTDWLNSHMPHKITDPATITRIEWRGRTRPIPGKPAAALDEPTPEMKAEALVGAISDKFFADWDLTDGFDGASPEGERANAALEGAKMFYENPSWFDDSDGMGHAEDRMREAVEEEYGGDPTDPIDKESEHAAAALEGMLMARDLESRRAEGPAAKLDATPEEAAWMKEKPGRHLSEYETAQGTTDRGYIKDIVDKGGHDITYFMKNPFTGRESLVSGQRINTMRPVNPPSPEAKLDKPAPRPLSVIAAEIRREWSSQKGGVNYAAAPYLDALDTLNSVDDSYYADSGRSIVAYFLANASSFRGPKAKELKAELKKALDQRKPFAVLDESKRPAAPAKASGSMTINFGLVNVPVQFFSATEDTSIKRQRYSPAGNPISLRNVDSVTGEEVAYGDIVMKYTTPNGDVVELTDDEVSSAAQVAPSGSASIKAVMPSSLLSTYHATGLLQVRAAPEKKKPSPGNQKAFGLLLGSLKNQDAFALLEYTSRGKTHPAALTSDGYLHILAYDDEIRNERPLEVGDATPDEQALADQLVGQMMTTDRVVVTDESSAKVRAYADAKVKGTTPAEQPKAAEAATEDLMASLKASLAEAGAASAPEPEASTPTPEAPAAPQAQAARQTGRSPSGKLRNFKAMGDTKLQDAYMAVYKENNDPEAMAALQAEWDKRGLPDITPQLEEGPAPMPPYPDQPGTKPVKSPAEVAAALEAMMPPKAPQAPTPAGATPPGGSTYDPNEYQPGRGPTGKLRNFKAMHDGKLVGVYYDVLDANNDQDALDAIIGVLKSRGLEEQVGLSMVELAAAQDWN